VGTGGLVLSDVLSAESAARLLLCNNEATGEQTHHFDLDLKQRSGASFPATLLHRATFGKDGVPRASRTLIIERQVLHGKAQDLPGGESRFSRFFNLTPMAIASLNPSGQIVGSNPSFARLFPSLIKSQTTCHHPCRARRQRPRAGGCGLGRRGWARRPLLPIARR
jgi:two-component system cell cycle sensor histidine kinase/response regulator CckA